MKFKVLTDRCNSYEKGQIIEVDLNKSRVAIEQTYKALFVMAENGEAQIIPSDGEPLIDNIFEPVVKAAVKAAPKARPKRRRAKK